ncbi:MAG: paraquat-inducible protein A [Pseudohongiellaceae bacterium]|jgi:paraquat-inducible protein A
MAVRAGDRGLVCCHSCGQLSRWRIAGKGEELVCPRCESSLHQRKPNGLAKTWALLIAAIVLYIPANLIPVMSSVSYGKESPGTIMEGVSSLFSSGQLALAIIVFVASVLVPVLKIMGLMLLLISVQCHSQRRPTDRARLYRLIELVGRWSMLDVFMISLMVALMQFGAISTVIAGTGAVCFAAVVVLTMFAAQSFDPRLIWDEMEERP